MTIRLTSRAAPSVLPMVGSRVVYEEALRQGAARAWEQRWEEAIAAYQQALAEFPDEPDALSGLGLALAGSRASGGGAARSPARRRTGPGEPRPPGTRGPGPGNAEPPRGGGSGLPAGRRYLPSSAGIHSGHRTVEGRRPRRPLLYSRPCQSPARLSEPAEAPGGHRRVPGPGDPLPESGRDGKGDGTLPVCPETGPAPSGHPGADGRAPLRNPGEGGDRTPWKHSQRSCRKNGRKGKIP